MDKIKLYMVEAEIATERHMKESNTTSDIRFSFDKCHEEFEREAREWNWENIQENARCVELLNEEVRLAEASGDGELFWRCCRDADDLGETFSKQRWELEHKAAELGFDEAMRLLAQAYFEGYSPDGENLDKALDYALDYIDHGGCQDDFEAPFLVLRPAHDAPIGERTLAWMKKVDERSPSPECTYAMARCYCDLDNAWMQSGNSRTLAQNKSIETALPFYRRAAEEGFFWSQLNLGVYLLATGNPTMTDEGVVWLGKARENIPDFPEPSEGETENETFRVKLAKIIGRVIFTNTGRTSRWVEETEERAEKGDLHACIDLAIAYMEGKDCPRNRGKALTNASTTLFLEEFDELLARMDELPENDRIWLLGELSTEANRIERACQQECDCKDVSE